MQNCSVVVVSVVVLWGPNFKVCLSLDIRFTISDVYILFRLLKLNGKNKKRNLKIYIRAHPINLNLLIELSVLPPRYFHNRLTEEAKAFS